MANPEATSLEIIATNRKARFKYDVVDKYEAGVALVGSEVKQLRAKHCSIEPAFARIRREELWLLEASIPPYDSGGYANHEEKRPRKLLLHRAELEKIEESLKTKGRTCVPLRLYFKHGLVKAEIAVVKGRTHGDRREAIHERESKREIARATRARTR
ncbi:MAG TPA: SsrA-binding protein SmpB [Planctomycetota bacterium]|nr:SsrA-binding protein SmpB [Planctomycetota bacterium]